MLIKCPECTSQVSDKAHACPHCGYPIELGFPSTSDPPPNIKPRKKRTRMRLPNGFGQISELKGRNLRKPFRAMVTVGKEENGKPICKLLKPEAYFETYNDAYAALVKYNQNPYDLNENITVKELYEKWSPKYYAEISKSSIVRYNTAWKFCAPIYSMNIRDVRIRHIKGCMDESEAVLKGEKRAAKAYTKEMIKSLISKLMDYAIEYDLLDKNIARSFKLPKGVVQEMKTVKKGHTVFTEEEMNLLWKHLDLRLADMVVVQCYSGWRPTEICKLKLEDVDIEQGFFKGGSKTEAGKNRLVPIHSKVMPIIKEHYDEAITAGSKYLFHNNTREISYYLYRDCFNEVKTNLGLDAAHTLHDCRKHFITQAKKYNLDEYAIKYIVGHTIEDLTENVYTERSPQWLKSEIEKIK